MRATATIHAPITHQGCVVTNCPSRPNTSDPPYHLCTKTRQRRLIVGDRSRDTTVSQVLQCDLMIAKPERRLRTPAAILEAAVHVLAERGDASMAEIAAATGVGRATLYRHFPTREALIDALKAEAFEELSARIEDAGLDRVSAPEALERLLRAFFLVGERYIFLVHERPKSGLPKEEEERFARPLRAVFQRGIEEGVLRDDLDSTTLLTLFGGLVHAAFEIELPRTVGIEEASATVVSLFLDGARRR
jgi:TetR/AcrR family transcriptional regulator, mexCD-oprJ operon repressor